MKLKITLMLFAALISASLLAGCQNKPTETPDNTENTENTENADTPTPGDVSESEIPGSSETGEAAGNTDTEQASDGAEANGYAEAYLETVNTFNDENQGSEGIAYSLVDFDGKGAPELVISTDTAISLYTYANGRVYTLMDGWGYGAFGVAGYDYIPGGNTLRGYNSDFAGAVRYENYYHIDEKHRFKPIYDKELYYTMFDDKNGNQTPDEDEPIDENQGHLYYGGTELSEEDYASMQIPGEYESLIGSMSFDELKSALTK